MKDDKASERGKTEYRRASADDYRNNLEPPDIKVSGSDWGLKGLSEKDRCKPDHLEGRLVREPHGDLRVLFWILMAVLVAVPVAVMVIYFYYG